MKNRWQRSLDAASAAARTPMPWARGDRRSAMILRRLARLADGNDPVATGLPAH